MFKFASKKSEVKIETPTLSRRAIVVENEAFKNELQNSADKLRDAIQRTQKVTTKSPLPSKGK